MPTAHTPNRNHVPRKQWTRWSESARAAFNHLYGLMSANPELFLHPRQDCPETEHWKTTCWNASWEAADLVQGEASKAGDVVEWIDPSGRPTARPYRVQA